MYTYTHNTIGGISKSPLPANAIVRLLLNPVGTGNSTAERQRQKGKGSTRHDKNEGLILDLLGPVCVLYRLILPLLN